MKLVGAAMVLVLTVCTINMQLVLQFVILLGIREKEDN